MARMQRNRESAMLSRQRKKMQLDELDRQNKQLQATNTHLSGAPSQLRCIICKGLAPSTYRCAKALCASQAVRHVVVGLPGLRHAIN